MKANAWSGNYQDNVTWPLSHDHDDNATAKVDPDVIDADLEDTDSDPAVHVLPAVEKVSTVVLHIHSCESYWSTIYKLRKIVRAVRSSPQHCQAWVIEIQFVHLEGSDPSNISNDCSTLHMLILDVRTQWAFTHQMLRMSLSLWLLLWVSDLWDVGCALDYRRTINSFISRNKDLHILELSDADWDSIKLVTSWLKSFHSATTEMSITKLLMLSTTHTIFRGLQDDIKDILHSLPNSVSPKIKLGLTDMYRKLSDYYYQFNASPFFTWAACMWHFITIYNSEFLTDNHW